MPAKPKPKPNPTTPFAPPSAQQFAEYLERHPANPPSWWSARLPMLVAAALIGVSLVTEGMLTAVLPWIALAWLFGHTTLRARRAQMIQVMFKQAQEIAMLRRYPEALRRSWRMLPKVAVSPMLHSQTVALIAHCLDAMRSYDAAIVGYDNLLKHLSPGQPIAVHLGVSRAAATLATDNLSGADDSLRRLHGAIEPYRNTPISAVYRLTQLAQQVRTHHFAEGVEEGGDLIEALRPLGVEAGYGHALMALCYFHQQGPDVDAQRSSESAINWWRQATLLMPAGALIERYPELGVLRELA